MSQKILWLILALLFSLDTNSQKLWSLQECIDYALLNNPDLKIQELNISIQEKNVLQSKMNMIPTLSANGSDVNNWGKTVDRYTNEFANSKVSSINLYLQSNLTIFRGLQLFNSIKRQNLELLAQKYDFAATRDMKSLEITTAYLQILYGKENLKTKTWQVNLTRMQVERTEKLVKAGTLAKGDLYNMKAQLASDESQKIKAENDLSLAYLSLKQLLNMPADTAFEIQIPNIDLTDGLTELLNPAQVYNYAVQNRPEILSAETRYNRSLKDLAISRGAYYPSLTFSAGFGTGYSGANVILDGSPTFTGWTPSGNFTTSGDTVLTPVFDYKTKPKPFNDQVSENKNYSLGLYLTVPIFNGLQARNQVGISKIAAQQAELQLEKTKLEMRKTIEQAYADARSAYKSFLASKTNVNALQESYNYAEKKYRAGMINSYEFNDAKIKLDNAKNDLLNAKYNYVFRVKVLDFYYGRPLTF